MRANHRVLVMLLSFQRVTVSVSRVCVLFPLKLTELQDNWCRLAWTRICLIQHYKDTIDSTAVCFRVYTYMPMNVPGIL